VVVRTWNLFHGNTLPPGRRAFLREMVELVTSDRPTVVCLQEIPEWALGSVGGWAEMQAVSVQTMPSRLGPVPLPPRIGRVLTSMNHGLLRSAFAGQGNAILLPVAAPIRETASIELNDAAFCRELGVRLDLSAAQLERWRAHRRICQIVRTELGGRRMLVANTHATSVAEDPRLADAELRRAFAFLEGISEPDEVAIFAGDLNITTADSATLGELAAAGWRDFGPGIDHVLLYGAEPVSARVWPDEERDYGGRLLSDHAPVELSF
jgi:endonuclease/exonuclease/phosphatase family metal-dependent hydrolase